MPLCKYDNKHPNAIDLNNVYLVEEGGRSLDIVYIIILPAETVSFDTSLFLCIHRTAPWPRCWGSGFTTRWTGSTQMVTISLAVWFMYKIKDSNIIKVRRPGSFS